MNANEIKELFAMASEREEKKYAWLRWLILLAAGAFTILVSFQTIKSEYYSARLLMRIAWAGLGFGILSGALAIYGEVHTITLLVKKLAVELNKDSEQRVPITAGPSVIQKVAEPICYASLIIAVLAMTTVAILTS
mgnify:CR=1 FL=1